MILVFFNASQAQKTEVFNKENQAQAFAILSAEYSKSAYLLAQKNFFSSSIYSIKQVCDTSILLSETAMQYADSALNFACDTCAYAKTIMLASKASQLAAITEFKKIKNLNNVELIHSLSKESMYAAANSAVDAYHASLVFELKAPADSDSTKTGIIDVAEEKALEKKENTRELTRLEADEFSYMTIKELYGKRLVEIDDELVLLKEEAKGSKGGKLNEINKAIEQLKSEEQECFKKMKGSQDRLINVRNDLSEEMLQIVHKDIFTTEKGGFYNENVPIPSNDKGPDGLVFKIQIGFFKSQLPPEHFDGIFPLSSEKVDNTYYRYIAGNFAKYNEAKTAKNTVVDKGYSDSFIVAYFNGEKISISEALKKRQDSD